MLHNLPHITGEATPGNEIPGRDADLVYKLMADMMTREDPKDVLRPFKQQQIRNTDALDLATTAQPSDELMKEAKKIGAVITADPNPGDAIKC